MLNIDDVLMDIKDYVSCLLKTRTAYRIFKKDACPDSNTIIGCIKCGAEFNTEISNLYNEEASTAKYCPFCGIKIVFNKIERDWVNREEENK